VRPRPSVAIVADTGDSVGPSPAAAPGPVETAVLAEVAGLPAAASRPGLAALALAMGRLLDHPRALSSKPAAARQLARFMDDLRQASAAPRRGGLRLVRAMTTPDGGA
jgi:hypothetical protein